MKRYLIFIILFIFWGSCTYDNEEDVFGIDNCTTDPVTFTNHIDPILKANCALPGCHVSGRQIPDLTDLNQIQNSAIQIKHRTSNRTMPPPESGKNLTRSEIEQISCWVDSGAIND
ncbi:hypothetical protein BH23BAC1_BH23BAC1_08350 [soil metagenome]